MFGFALQTIQKHSNRGELFENMVTFPPGASHHNIRLSIA